MKIVLNRKDVNCVDEPIEVSAVAQTALGPAGQDVLLLELAAQALHAEPDAGRVSGEAAAETALLPGGPAALELGGDSQLLLLWSVLHHDCKAARD